MTYTKEQRRAWVSRNIEKVRTYHRNYAPLWRARNKEKIQIYNLRRKQCKEKWAKAHLKQHKLARLRWRDAHKNDVQQRKKIYSRGVAQKIINFKRCSYCGSCGNLHRHHPDYEKPLDVIILCRDCHGEEHRKINRHIANELETKRVI